MKKKKVQTRRFNHTKVTESQVQTENVTGIGEFGLRIFGGIMRRRACLDKLEKRI